MTPGFFITPNVNTMKLRTPPRIAMAAMAALALSHTWLAPAQAQTQLDTALQAIGDLAHVNGQALACSELKAARRAKDLMITHAPKTARFGNVFEENTQQSYAAQISTHATCPDAAALSAQLDTLANRLQGALPVTPSEKQKP